MKILITAAFACLLTIGAEAQTPFEVERSILVTDDAGVPLPDADVRITWREYSLDSQKPDGGTLPDYALVSSSRSCHLMTDRCGLCRFSENIERYAHLAVENVTLQGYELLVNLRNRWLPRYYLHRGVPDHPFRLVMRKREAEKDLPLKLDLDVRVCVSCEEAAVGAKSVDVNLFNGVKRKLGPDYIDFTMTPRYDVARRKWSVCFSTTNAGCGLVASPRRRYIAPETGYQPRIEVPEDDCLNPAFTLYLKTREPHIYALVRPVLSFADEKAKAEKCVLRLGTAAAVANLWGTRVFETDPFLEKQGVMRELDPLPLLVEHRYPKRPDLKALRLKYRQMETEAEQKRLARLEQDEREMQISSILDRARARGTYASELAALETRCGGVRSVQHVLVVDEAGKPLPGADVSFAWEVVDTQKGTREPMSFHYRTGNLGRVMVNYNPNVSEHYRVETVELPGYVFDSALNPKLELPAFDQPLGSDAQPIRLVLRPGKRD